MTINSITTAINNNLSNINMKFAPITWITTVLLNIKQNSKIKMKEEFAKYIKNTNTLVSIQEFI